MSSSKIVFHKVKELHYKMRAESHIVPIGRVATELQMTNAEVGEHLASLKTLRLIKFSETDSVQITKIGLSTTVG